MTRQYLRPYQKVVAPILLVPDLPVIREVSGPPRFTWLRHELSDGLVDALLAVQEEADELEVRMLYARVLRREATRRLEAKIR